MSRGRARNVDVSVHRSRNRLLKQSREIPQEIDVEKSTDEMILETDV